jgi:uncharacterized membrane protein
MTTVPPETFISLIYIAAGGLFILLGVPLYFRWIPPNRFYGFRTARTLADPAVWYPVNRVTGGWLTIIGAVTAGAAAAVERLNFSLTAAAAFNVTVVVVGMGLMLVHSLRTLWRVR